MLTAARAFRPHTVVTLGDFIDFESLSMHPPDEPGKHDFEDELESVLKALNQLDALGATTKIYTSGNHEFRLNRFLAAKAPALYRHMDLPRLLGLAERGWKWVPYRKSISVGKLHITHDTGQAGMNAHRTSAQAFMGSAIIGHTHRLAYEVRGRFDDVPYLAAMFGWLGDAAEAAKYAHEAKSAEWAHGFGVGYKEPDGVVHVQPIPIVNKKCMLNGVLHAI